MISLLLHESEAKPRMKFELSFIHPHYDYTILLLWNGHDQYYITLCTCFLRAGPEVRWPVCSDGYETLIHSTGADLEILEGDFHGQ